MNDAEPPFLHGAMILLDECNRTVEALLARFESSEDARERRKIVEAALHELKVHAAIEELVLPDALEPEMIETEKEPRRHILRLVAELESMTGAEKRHDAKVALLAANVRRHILREEISLFTSAARESGLGPGRPRGHSSPGPRPLTLLGFEGRFGTEAAERSQAGSTSLLAENHAARDGGLVTKFGTGLRRAAAVAAGAMLLASASVRAQSNQGGGEQLNPNTSLNSIIGGGGTGAATPIEKVVVPVTPASVPGPASEEKDRPPKSLPAPKAPAKKGLSDRKLAKKIRGEIIHDLTLPAGSQGVQVAAAGGKVTLTGTVLTEEDKYKIAAKAAELAGAENVANLIEVKPGAPAP